MNIDRQRGYDNRAKGAKYELYVRDFLLTKSKDVYLWADIPMTILVSCGIYRHYSDKRKFRETALKENHILDTGCDILYFDGNWKIVQCKNYTGSVKINDLAGFFYMMVISKLHGQLYYTSSISKNLEIYNCDKVEYIKLEISSEVVEKPKMELYPFQKDAIRAVKPVKRGILYLPCGCGKTIVSIIWARQFKLIIVFSPLRQYALQNLVKYASNTEGYQQCLVDSDGDRDVESIKKMFGGKLILSSTYKSVDVIRELLEDIEKVYGDSVGIVIDEFHNLTRDNVSKVDDDFNKVLTCKEFNYLFLSATPRVFEIEDDEIDIEDITGKVEFKYEFRDAIKEGYICDYDIYVPEIIVDSIPNKASFLLRALDEKAYRKCIAYLKNKSEVDEFMKEIEKSNEHYGVPLKVSFITSDTSQTDRVAILKDFVEFSGVYILCSIRILDECIDIPECDSIFLSKSIKSKIKIIQRMCRANRKDKKNPNKVSGIFIWCNEYSDVVDTISCLKEFDTGFTKEKVRIVNHTDEEKSCMIDRKDETKYKELNRVVAGAEKILTWDKKKELLFEYANLNKMYPKRTILYKNVQLGVWFHNQKSEITNNTDEIYVKLSQNEYLRPNLNGFLSNKNKEKNKLGWDKTKDLLFEYSNKHQMVPTKRMSYKNCLLGRWLSAQKREITSNKDEMYIKLSQNEYVKNSINKYFLNKEKEKDKIKLSLDEWRHLLFEYADEYKTGPTQKTSYKKAKVGTWFSNQKAKIENKEDKLYIKLSENNYIKICLDKHILFKEKKLDWDGMQRLLVEYCIENNTFPPVKTSFKGQPVGRWIAAQKRIIKSNTDDKYLKLSQNSYIKSNIDAYLAKKQSRAQQNLLKSSE